MPVAVNARTYTSQVKIKVNGSELDMATLDKLAEIVVEQSLHLPSMFIVRFHDFGLPDDHSFHLADSDTFKIGAEVEIQMSRGEGVKSVLKGEVTSLEVDVDTEAGPIFTVRGYDRAHRLHRGRKTRSFLNQTDSDIVTRVASEAGLSARVENTGVLHQFVWQHNQTDWEFVKERAARHGYEVFVDGRNLYFQKPKNGQIEAPPQAYGQSLLSFHVTLSTQFQASEVIVRGWDPTNKKAIIGRATRGSLAPQVGHRKSGKETTSTAFSIEPKVFVVDRPVASQGEADRIAQAVFDEIDGMFIQAEGTCLGEPDLKPRTTVQISGLGVRFSGKYYVTSATHRLTRDEGYTTEFVVSGRQTNSVLELTHGNRGGTQLPSVVIGVVTNNSDPDGLGRVKVKLPWLSDNDESWWARLASPAAGQERGFYFIPEVNDEVLVAFEHGDINRPYIVGVLWNGMDHPPKRSNQVVGGDGKVNQRIIKTRSGHTVTFDDTQGSEKITIVDKTGNNQIEIDSTSNKISIKANGDVTIDSTGKTTVNAQNNVEVTTQASATVKATGSAEVSATGSLTLKGQGTVSIEAGGPMSISAKGPLTIRGALVNIN